MGIKFYCPKGHKLNVKDFLAGKKGACPHCGAQFIIPLQSRPKGDTTPVPELVGAAADADGVPELPAATTPITASPAAAGSVPSGLPSSGFPTALSSSGASGAPTTAYPAAPMPAYPARAPAAVIPASSGSVPVGLPVSPRMAAPVSVATAPVATAPVATAPVATAVSAAPNAPTYAGAVRTAAPDPIDESPQAVWYVRPPSGGQYGPAKGDVMRRWTAEGRVSADSLVWREGWGDWKPANQVFPALAVPPVPSQGGPPAPVALGLGGAPAGLALGPSNSVEAPLSGTPRGLPARRKSNSSMGLVIVVMLGLMAVILLAALLYIIMRG